MEDDIQALIERFPEDIRYVYKNMIPAFQKSYASYIFQTPDPKIQDRRIKNLAKSFRKNEKETYHYIQPLSENDLDLSYHSEQVFEVICNGERQLVYELEASEHEVNVSIHIVNDRFPLAAAEAVIEEKIKTYYPEIAYNLKYY